MRFLMKSSVILRMPGIVQGLLWILWPVIDVLDAITERNLHYYEAFEGVANNSRACRQHGLNASGMDILKNKYMMDPSSFDYSAICQARANKVKIVPAGGINQLMTAACCATELQIGECLESVSPAPLSRS